jgi:hypothetical protein
VRRQLTAASESLAKKLDNLNAARKASRELHAKIINSQASIEV